MPRKRTPIGRSHEDKGIFRDIRADELLSVLFKDFAKRYDPAVLDDIYIGCVGQHLEQGKNIGRLTSLLSGYPDSIPAPGTKGKIADRYTGNQKILCLTKYFSLL